MLVAMEATKKPSRKKKEQMKDRIKSQIKRLNLNPNMVASMMGVNHPSVYNWCNGKSEPNGANLHKLASVLQVTTQYLLGLEEYEAIEVPDAHGSVALLPLFPDNIKIMKSQNDIKATPSAMLPAMVRGGPHRFFLEMQDQTMTSHSGDISVPQGSFVLIDPDQPAEDRDYVAVRLVAGTRTLVRRLLVHGKDKWLEALDPSVPRVKITASTVILGTVTDIQIRLK